MESHILITNILRGKGREENLVFELDPKRVKKLRNLLIGLFAIVVIGAPAGAFGGWALAKYTIHLYEKTEQMHETMASLKYNVAAVKDYVGQGAELAQLKSQNRQLSTESIEKFTAAEIKFMEARRKEAKEANKKMPPPPQTEVPYGVGGE